ncbi:NAD(P)H-hydrate dehydratase [Curtobacterium sp. RHCKG23]|uniref:ADP-dependent (S)-NAD(P)H-hydrate dehydratase n=1 Tax=Curtobacterium citri TaxID=3055139 RepID=A0ABT7T4D8_9MICO|nr:NAD(P)H-hydrate dehydratase [Curtobacterium citri]MDM7884440.1 NAD(P)H-hydrate dehydratase [Curtobacterium citri]
MSSDPEAPQHITPNVLREWPLPEPGAGKYGRGQVLVIGGASYTPGAAMLSALAALRVGAGRLTLAVGASVAHHVAVAVPESGVLPLAEDADGHVAVGALAAVADTAGSSDAVLVGPGLDEPDGARDLVAGIADAVGPEAFVVLDAFALGVAADVEDRLAPLHGRLVMTPNSGEAERLLGRDCGDDDVADAREIAERYGAVVALSDVIAAPDGRAWVKGTGSGGLGTSGSGDVLSGVVVGLLARGAEPAQAVAWASYVHAAAGDRLAVQVGPLGYLASELLAEIPRVLVELGG